MARAFLVVMDSVGIGGAPDADQFFNDGIPDTGSNTVAHIAQACANGHANIGRNGSLKLPNLAALGLWRAVGLASGDDKWANVDITGLWGAATEVSPGKDTPSGHWELAGLPVPWNWHYFSKKQGSFPPDVIKAACAAAGTDQILGNCHASGTQIIAELGGEHIRTGYPICYTSADSVFQIAAHEDHFGLARLLEMCKKLTPMLHDMKIGRVIARPFTGNVEDGFNRTSNRKDFAIEPPAPTLCDWVQSAGRKVYAVGKIGDIFSMRGIDDLRKGKDRDLMTHLSNLAIEAAEGSLTFANFVEFDSLYGHRRDVAGYAAHLEWFDQAIGTLLPQLREDDMLILTADHGNDPTWPGTDHTRETVPVLIHGRETGSIGQVAFADVAASIADHLNIKAQGPGVSFLKG